MYKKIFAESYSKYHPQSPAFKGLPFKLKKNQHLIHLWTDEGYKVDVWDNIAYVECDMVLMIHLLLLIKNYFLILNVKWEML